MGHRRVDIADSRHRFWTVYSYVIAYRWETNPYRSSPSCTGRGSWMPSFSSGFSDDPRKYRSRTYFPDTRSASFSPSPAFELGCQPSS
jgi:hypothetical protein